MTFAVEKAFGGKKIMLAEVQAKLAAAEKQVSSGKILPAKEALATGSTSSIPKYGLC